MTTRRIYLEGFQLTVGPGGLLIESTDYHARPLFLDEKALGQIGLALKEDRPDRPKTRPNPTIQRLLDF